MEVWKKESLLLAKQSILEDFWKADLNWYYPENKELLEKRACFVTLKKLDGTEHWSLRGCIGSLIATRPLYEDIIVNAKNAAFSDPRFPPLTYEETNNLLVEISVLTEPQPLYVNSIEDLLEYLKQKHPGLIIKLWYNQATFLPSVWEELPDEEQFLVHLIYKAGLTPEEFIKNFDKVEIFVYYTIEFKDKWDVILSTS